MSCRGRREERRQERQERRRAAKELRQRQAAEGLESRPTSTIGNGTSPWKTVEEEQARQEALEEQLQAYRSALPTLLKRLGKIHDPRNPKTIRHKATVLLLYGILQFVYQMASRREANRQMTLPQFQENLRQLFPELESVAHQDTLNRLLAGIEVNEIEEALVELLQRFIRKKKFLRYLVGNCYPVAIDGTQKMARNTLWTEQCLERDLQRKQKDGSLASETQYYVYVLEANLAFANGMTIPLLSEFLTYEQYDQERDKQDCHLGPAARESS